MNKRLVLQAFFIDLSRSDKLQHPIKESDQPLIKIEVTGECVCGAQIGIRLVHLIGIDFLLVALRSPRESALV